MHPFTTTFARITRHASKLAGVVLMLAAAAPARAQTPVDFGDTISDPGVYFLRGNQSGAGDGIVIESDDVLLLLARFTLRGDGSGIGINASGHDNVTVWGGRVTNFRYGMFLNGGDDCTVRDSRIDYCENGLYFVVMKDSAVLRLRADHNESDGVLVLNSSDCRLVSVLSHDNGGNGIVIAHANTLAAAGNDSGGNLVRLCWAAYNDRDGIQVRDSQDNVVKRNQCVGNGRAGIRIDSTSDVVDEISSQGIDPSRDNHVESNWCVFNDNGIVVEWNSTSNTLFQNTALANVDRDMVDHNDAPPCANTWFLNFFLTKDGDGEDCIF